MKVHDYTTPVWGHTVSVWEQRKTGWYVCGFGHGVAKGDCLKLRTVSGQAKTYHVTSIQYETNPTDMFWADITTPPPETDE